MAMALTSVLKSGIHNVIQFLMLENVPGHEIHHLLWAVYKNLNIEKKSTGNHWVKSFKAGANKYRQRGTQRSSSGEHDGFGE